MDNSLKHYGTLGMRWGKRKKKDSPDHTAFSEIRKKKLRDMSNEEISAVTKRMRLIKAYRGTSFLRGKRINELSNDQLEAEVRRNSAMIEAFKKPFGTVKIRDVKKMSDAEIKAFLERSSLEKQYKDIALADIRGTKKLIKDFLNANN